MTRFLEWLDRVPLSYLMIVAGALGLAPYFPEPHLWDKLGMLMAGHLRRPADIFDLFFHGTPVVFLGIRLSRDWLRRHTG